MTDATNGESGPPEYVDDGSFDKISIHMSILDHPNFRLIFTVTPEALATATRRDKDFKVPTEEITLAEYRAAEKTLTLYPTSTNPDSTRFTMRKIPYASITLEGYEHGMFVGKEGRIDDLPDGFIKGANEGFGVNPKYNQILHTVIQSGARDLRITQDEPADRIVGTSYLMSYDEFETLRKRIDKTNLAARAAARAEKAIYLHNELLSSVDPVKHPIKAAPFQGDALQRAAGQAVSSPGKLKPADRKAVVKIVKTEIRAIAEKDDTDLLELNREIEVVTLEVVIEKMTKMLDAGLKEDKWQKFLSVNPFILRLAFGLPIMVFGEQVSVGGIRFDNTGGKLADFVVKSGTFGNLAIIEIKTPDTVLMEHKVYRGNVHAPTRELCGGVNQVIDQRYMLGGEIDVRKIRSRKFDVWNYGVKCYVIAGRTIVEGDALLQDAKRKSFEFYRNSLVDVTVITFDELLEKLRALLSFLKPEASTEA